MPISTVALAYKHETVQTDRHDHQRCYESFLGPEFLGNTPNICWDILYKPKENVNL